MPRQEKSHGPDWTDVRTMVVAIDSLHGCTTWLDLAPIGAGAGTEWQMTVTSVWPVLKDSQRALRLSTQVRWPNPNQATFEAAVFELLYRHDVRFGKEVYQQERLPGT